MCFCVCFSLALMYFAFKFYLNTISLCTTNIYEIDKFNIYFKFILCCLCFLLCASSLKRPFKKQTNSSKILLNLPKAARFKIVLMKFITASTHQLPLILS